MFFDRLCSGPAAVALLQLFAAALLGLGIRWWAGAQAGLSVTYGVVVALLATLLLLARRRTLELHPGLDTRQLRAAKRTVWERLALVAVLLSWGFLSGHVMPGWMLLGFVVGQALWFVALLLMQATDR